MKEKEFRERIARIQRIQKLNEDIKRYSNEEKNNLSDVLPAINGVKKTIENFTNKTEKIIEEER